MTTLLRVGQIVSTTLGRRYRVIAPDAGVYRRSTPGWPFPSLQSVDDPAFTIMVPRDRVIAAGDQLPMFEEVA